MPNHSNDVRIPGIFFLTFLRDLTLYIRISKGYINFQLLICLFLLPFPQKVVLKSGRIIMILNFQLVNIVDSTSFLFGHYKAAILTPYFVTVGKATVIAHSKLFLPT